MSLVDFIFRSNKTICAVFTLAALSFSILRCAPEKHDLHCDIRGEADLKAWSAHNLKSSEICLVTHNDKLTGYTIETNKNHKEYTAKYGYPYQFRTGNISGPLFKDPAQTNKVYREGFYWQKITAVKDELKRNECRWVMWIDADTIFTNYKSKVEDVLREYAFRIHNGKSSESHLILSSELVTPDSPVNAGVILVRNSQWSKDFFDHAENAYPYYKDHGLPEQDFLQDAAYQRIKLGQFDTYLRPPVLKVSFDNLLPQTLVIPQRSMNSFHRYGKNDGNAQWKKGDFIAHLSGSSNAERLEMIRILTREIIR